MAVNFCCGALGSKIICQQDSTDNHEIENLLKNPFQNAGFLTSSFIRPPVDILVQFPCPVQLCCLLINGKLGSQQSLGCEIFIQSQPPGEFDAFNHGIFRTIGKYYWDCDKKGVHLICDRHSTCKLSENQDYVSQNLSKDKSKILELVWSLRLRILKTHNSSVPALARLEAWGYVSHSSKPELARKVLFKWYDMNKPKVNHESRNEIVTDQSTAQETVPDSDEIPEEFLDQLTFEVMALPVRLPSGNVIDETTLERFKREQASLGRSPCDPFTWKTFTADHKPLYDVSLKARIDHYLLSHSHCENLQNIPRTTGPIQRSSDSLLSNQPTSSSKTAREWWGKSATLAGNKASTSQGEPHKAPVSHRLVTYLASNQRQVSQPSLPEVCVVKSVASSQASCTCGRKGIIYSLPCAHSICRTCLMESKTRNELLCRRCMQPFTVDQPVRLHVQT